MQDYESIYRVSAELGSHPSCEEADVTLEDKGKVVARTMPGETSHQVDAYQYEIEEGPYLTPPKSGRPS